MKQDQDGHDFTQGKLACTVAPLGAAGKALRVAGWLKGSAKVIDMTEEFEYTHSEAPFRYTFGFSTHSVAEK